MLRLIWDAIKSVANFIVGLVRVIINGILNFVQHIVKYFKNLPLIKGRDIPFIADARNKEFADMVKRAPAKNVGIFEATLNDETNEIENMQWVEAENVDEKTKNVLGNEPIVVLN